MFGRSYELTEPSLSRLAILPGNSAARAMPTSYDETNPDSQYNPSVISVPTTSMSAQAARFRQTPLSLDHHQTVLSTSHTGSPTKPVRHSEDIIIRPTGIANHF
jgi:hypothetical protein